MATITVVPVENEVEKRIIGLIGKHPEGMTIAEISEKLNFHRHTVSKYVYGLVKADQLTRRRVGIASLYYPKKVKL